MHTAELIQQTNGQSNGQHRFATPAGMDWRQRFIGHRKIAICAKAPDTIKQAPWGDAELVQVDS